MDERLHDIKCKLMDIICDQLDGDLSRVCAKELGEVFDMLKDTAETMYYFSVVDAMENASEEEKAAMIKAMK